MDSRATQSNQQMMRLRRWQWAIGLVGLVIWLVLQVAPALAQGLVAVGLDSQSVEWSESLSVPEAVADDEDLTPPRLSASPLIVRQADDSLNLLAGVTALDDREAPVTVTVEGYEDPSHVSADTFKAGISYLTYQAQDQAGNRAYLTRAVIVTYRHPLMAGQTDFVAPEVKSAPVYLRAGSQDLETFVRAKENVVAYDQVEGDLSQRFYFLSRSNQDLDLNQPGRYLIKWEVQDRSHNRAVLDQWVVVLPATP